MNTNPPFFFKEACIGVNLVEICTPLLYCFVFMANTSIQLASSRSKTGFFETIFHNSMKRSAKTAPEEVFLEYLLIFILFRKSVKILFTNSPPASVSSKFGFLFEVIRIFSKVFYSNSNFIFQRNCPTKFTGTVDYY